MIADVKRSNIKNSTIKRHGWPILVILLFIIASYVIISSEYNWAHGDAGVYARSARILYETNKIDVTYSASSLIGQLLFSNIFCHILGFRLKTLHISVFAVNFLSLVALYLLLSELGLNRFLAVCGSLTLFVNPISLKMIDWYMTEPFFMFYLIASILFFIKGLREDKYLFLYLGGIFGVLAVLTRQHAVSLSVALVLLCLIYRKSLKKGTLIHTLIASALPIFSIGLFYVYLFWNKGIHSDVPYTAAASGNLAAMKSFLNPLTLFSRLYFDSLFSLHYSVVYLAPLFATFAICLLINPKRIRELRLNFPISLVSLLLVSIGTMILYIRDNRLMPYIPSIFSIGGLPRIFGHQIISPEQAPFILTGLTWAGAIIILIKILEYFCLHKENDYSLEKMAGAALSARVAPSAPVKDKKGHKSEKPEKEKPAERKDDKSSKNIQRPNKQPDLGIRFFYFWGIAYLAVAIFLGLQYDRYILPISIFMIYVLLSHFPWIGEQKKTLIIVLVLVYSHFIFEIASYRLFLNLQWDAGESLISEKVPPCAINGGLGFNHFYNFDCITEGYKNIRVARPINWYKFHPLAEFFVVGDSELENKIPGLTVYRTFTQERLFGLLKGKCYIYKRREGFRDPVWI